MTDSDKLADLLTTNREPLMAEWRSQVRTFVPAGAQSDPVLNDHMPYLIDELAVALRKHSGESIPEALASMSAYSHGLQRLEEQYDITEVVAEYNILRGCIHDLASANGVTLQGNTFHIFNRVMDGAIGMAVRTYANQKAHEVRKQREEYLSFVAHDLRTPLSAISMVAAVLEMPVKQGEHAKIDTPSLVRILRRNVDSMSSLVAIILEENSSLLAETQVKVEARHFDLWALVEDIALELHPIATDSSCTVANEVKLDVIGFADTNLLKRVFRNLIFNAIKYTPNGTVTIGAMTRADDGSIECWVQDTGAGIPADRVESIFQKLETDPEREDGKGLGLAIVQTFIHAHGGDITVESKEGIGTTFHFFLPGPGAPAG